MKKIFYLSVILLFAFGCGTSTEGNHKGNLDTVTEVTEVKKEKVEEFSLESMLKIKDEAELISRYGKENVIREKQLFAEGTVELTVTLLYKGTNKALRFMWEDDSVHFAKPLSVYSSSKNSPWSTQKGIKVGMKMTELEKLHGQPFEFYGFEWDFGGTVSFTNENIEGVPISATLGACSEADYQKKEYLKLLGDGSFNSSSPEAKELNPCVETVTVHAK